LNYENTKEIAEINEIQELNIGHSIIAKSLDIGIAEAVKTMKTIMIEARK
jgi:pyridoxine 5-phosphate synthase